MKNVALEIFSSFFIHLSLSLSLSLSLCMWEMGNQSILGIVARYMLKSQIRDLIFINKVTLG